MCGIAGVLGSTDSGRINIAELVKDAIVSIRHRGPDEEGYFNEPSCFLGMCRLAIIDIDGGRQPNFGTRNEIVSVFNGEIYNFQELKELLKNKGYDLKNTSDSECIPFLYEEFGDEFPKLLQGMFAIALWDFRKKRGLLIRDRFGKKPLWFHHSKTGTYFASELKGLLALGIPRTLNLKSIPEYLQFGYVNSPRSVYEGVSQVNPGTVLVIEREIIKEFRFWDFPIKESLTISYEEAKEHTFELLRAAVETRLVSERPIGAFLSGGIDSSLITAIMCKELNVNTKTFTIGFDDINFDESRYASSVATALGVKHYERIIQPDPSFILNKLSKVLDQPFADSSIIPTYLLSEFARDEVVVALGGDGGDEVFGGYRRYHLVNLLHKINYLLALSPAPLLRGFFNKSESLERIMRLLRFRKPVDRYLELQSLISSSELKTIVLSELKVSLENLELLELWRKNESPSLLRSMQAFDLATYLPGDLMYKADMASMASSLEVRSPFLDYRVVEFGLQLPEKFKLQKGKGKRILKDILYNYVPREIVDRPKMGFGIPRAQWLRNELSDLVEETLFRPDASIRSWIDMRELRVKVNQHNAGRNLDRVIWPILMLELWATNWLN